MKNMYAIINSAIKAGAAKVFVVGYTDNNGCTYTEVTTLSEARRIKAVMTAEGRKPFIDVYTR